MDRVGTKLSSIDQINNIRLEPIKVKGTNNPRQNYNSGSKHTDPQQFYQNQFTQFKQKLRFKQSAYDLAMQKVQRFIEMKNRIKNGEDGENRQKIQGKKEAVAVCIMYHVSKELDLEIKIDTIVKLFDKSNRPKSEEI